MSPPRCSRPCGSLHVHVHVWLYPFKHISLQVIIFFLQNDSVSQFSGCTAMCVRVGVSGWTGSGNHQGHFSPLSPSRRECSSVCCLLFVTKNPAFPPNMASLIFWCGCLQKCWQMETTPWNIFLGTFNTREALCPAAVWQSLCHSFPRRRLMSRKC